MSIKSSNPTLNVMVIRGVPPVETLILQVKKLRTRERKELGPSLLLSDFVAMPDFQALWTFLGHAGF